MKIRTSFVTNSSTVCYMVLGAQIKTTLFNKDGIYKIMKSFIQEMKLETIYVEDDDPINVYIYDDVCRVYITTEIPFDKALNVYKEELKNWLTRDDIEVINISVEVNGYRDG